MSSLRPQLTSHTRAKPTFQDQLMIFPEPQKTTSRIDPSFLAASCKFIRPNEIANRHQQRKCCNRKHPSEANKEVSDQTISK
uniref:Uncharacterized protein n=1 Tax=Rhizophora mucronata TaxID=61149 RepID=A0A2P2K6K0_RHIMU